MLYQIFCQIVGFGLILFASADVYMTVLYPRTGKDVVSLKVSKGIWEIFRWVSRQIDNKDKKVLTYCGPTLLLAIATLWVSTFTLGFALLLWPALGTGIATSQGQTPTDFAAAFYYSGAVLTTLGMSSMLPQTDLWRLITIFEAAVGFSIITITFTYLLSVYNALTRRNTFAFRLHHRTGQKANAVDLLVGLQGYGKFEPAVQYIDSIAQGLFSILESHHAYPVLHYFRFQQPHYALSRMLLVSLDLTALIETALHPQTYRVLRASSAVTELESGSLEMLSQLADSFLDNSKPTLSADKTEWRTWYFRATDILQQHGIETVLDTEAGADNYVARREKWNTTVASFAIYMEYEWRESAPAEQDR